MILAMVVTFPTMMGKAVLPQRPLDQTPAQETMLELVDRAEGTWELGDPRMALLEAGHMLMSQNPFCCSGQRTKTF